MPSGVLLSSQPAAPGRISIWDPVPHNQTDDHLPSGADDLVIHAIDGYVKFVPYFFANWTAPDTDPPDAPMNCSQRRVTDGYGNYLFRAALSKDKWTIPPLERYYNQASGTQGWVAPQRDPLNPVEYIDSRFQKTWMRDWFSNTGVDYSIYFADCNDVIGVCSDTSGSISGGGSSNSVLTDGSGVIDGNDPVTGTITTTCTQEALATGQEFGGEFHRRTMPPHITLRLSSRRRHRLQENEGLSLHFNYTARDLIGASGVGHPFRQHAVGYYVFPFFRLLVEAR